MGKVVSDYVSDHTLFMQELMAKNPQMAEEQKAGRALWWDKTLDADEQRRKQEARLPQKPYVYFDNF